MKIIFMTWSLVITVISAQVCGFALRLKHSLAASTHERDNHPFADFIFPEMNEPFKRDAYNSKLKPAFTRLPQNLT